MFDIMSTVHASCGLYDLVTCRVYFLVHGLYDLVTCRVYLQLRGLYDLVTCRVYLLLRDLYGHVTGVPISCWFTSSPL